MLFSKDFPACQGMVDGRVLRLVLLTLLKHELPEEAERVGRYMMEAYNEGNGILKPNSDHYALLIRAHVQAGNLIKAKEYLDWMERSENADVDTYNLYLRALLTHEDDPSDEMDEIV